ncbi:MAG: hypothetical protein R2939_22355 [Kofleriaceae bacterium]
MAKRTDGKRAQAAQADATLKARREELQRVAALGYAGAVARDALHGALTLSQDLGFINAAEGILAALAGLETPLQLDGPSAVAFLRGQAEAAGVVGAGRVFDDGDRYVDVLRRAGLSDRRALMVAGEGPGQLRSAEQRLHTRRRKATRSHLAKLVADEESAISGLREMQKNVSRWAPVASVRTAAAQRAASLRRHRDDAVLRFLQNERDEWTRAPKTPAVRELLKLRGRRIALWLRILDAAKPA